MAKCPPGCTCGRHRRGRRPDTKKKISEGLIKHYRERGPVTAQEGDKKRCNRCHQWKPVGENGDFYRKTATKLKSGVSRQYWDSVCKPCRVEYNREHLRKKTPEELSAMWGRYRDNWIAKYGPEEIRRKEAEKRALGRDKKGLPPSSRPAVFKEEEIRLPIDPIIDFVKGEMEKTGVNNKELSRRAGIDDSYLRRLLEKQEVVKSRSKTGRHHKGKDWGEDGVRVKKITEINLGIVDKLLLAFDSEYLLTILYPDA